MSLVLQGQVKWYNEGKDFGFITQANGASDLYVSGMRGSQFGILTAGQVVDYKVTEGRRGPTAIIVSVKK